MQKRERSQQVATNSPVIMLLICNQISEVSELRFPSWPLYPRCRNIRLWLQYQKKNKNEKKMNGRFGSKKLV